VDQQAIKTPYLIGSQFIGDYNAISMACDAAVAVYMGTSHPRGGVGINSPHPEDETLYSNRIIVEESSRPQRTLSSTSSGRRAGGRHSVSVHA
jgi:hypothetical protein